MATAASINFSQVFEEHYDFLWAALRRLGVQHRDIEDVIHIVLVRVHDRLTQYDPARPLRPWLFAFAVRAASEYRRAARHRVDLDSDRVEGFHSDADPEAEASKREAATLVARALEALSSDTRPVFVMHELEDMPMPDIATALEIPVNTAYSRLRLARAAFAKRVVELRGQEATQ